MRKKSLNRTCQIVTRDATFVDIIGSHDSESAIAISMPPTRMISTQRVVGEIRVQTLSITIAAHWIRSKCGITSLKTWHSHRVKYNMAYLLETLFPFYLYPSSRDVSRYIFKMAHVRMGYCAILWYKGNFDYSTDSYDYSKWNATDEA